LQLSFQAANPETFGYTLVGCEDVNWIEVAHDRIRVQWRNFAIALRVAFQRVFIVVSVYFFMTQSENFWIQPGTWDDSVEVGDFLPDRTELRN
jgi:hypothetical protein